jgi:hypothetical protein
MTTQFLEGTKVHYTSRHNGKKENGIVKTIRNGDIFVVFYCNGDWENYKNYTGAFTKTEDLTLGWVNENQKQQ